MLSEKIGERFGIGTDANNGLGVWCLMWNQHAEAIKFTKFRSNRIPAPAGLEMWHIDKVDQADFFGFSPDGCLEMPGRDFVPDYTTVRLVNPSDRLGEARGVNRKFSWRSRKRTIRAKANCRMTLAFSWQDRLVRSWVPNTSHEWENVQLVVDRLRREFAFERNRSRRNHRGLA